jgi:hypothetical protein
MKTIKRRPIATYKEARLKAQADAGSMDAAYSINYKAHRYPYVSVGSRVHQSALDWCLEHIDHNSFDEISGCFFFNNEDDATLFKLTWM